VKENGFPFPKENRPKRLCPSETKLGHVNTLRRPRVHTGNGPSIWFSTDYRKTEQHRCGQFARTERERERETTRSTEHRTKNYFRVSFFGRQRNDPQVSRNAVSSRRNGTHQAKVFYHRNSISRHPHIQNVLVKTPLINRRTKQNDLSQQ